MKWWSNHREVCCRSIRLWRLAQTYLYDICLHVYNNKIRRVRYSVQPAPRRNHQAETVSPKDEGFLPWWFRRGFWLNRIPNELCFFLYLSRDFVNVYLHGELFLLSYCHISFYQQCILLECTFELFISWQSLGIQANTMTMSCDNDMAMGSYDQTDFESLLGGRTKL